MVWGAYITICMIQRAHFQKTKEKNKTKKALSLLEEIKTIIIEIKYNQNSENTI